MATTAVGKVPIPYQGNELTVTPAGTGNPNVDGYPAILTGFYSPYDPTVLLLPVPVTAGLLAAPSSVAAVATGGSGTSTTYNVFAFIGNAQEGYQETPLSTPTVTVSGPATLDGTHSITVSWAFAPGAQGYGVVRNGALIQRITSPGTLSFTDTGQATIGGWSAATTAPLCPPGLLYDGYGQRIGSLNGQLNTNPRPLNVAQDAVGTQAQISELASVQEPAFSAAMIWPMVGPVAGGFKTLVFQITTAFTMAAQQPTIQFFIGRTTGGQNDADHPLIGAAQTLTAAGATSIPVGSIYWDADTALAGMSGPTPSAIAQLRHPYAYWGAKLTFPVSAPTTGAAVLYVDSSGV